jgi:hypothetical protein
MIRSVRPLLCLFIAIAFAISSVGWSNASARQAAEPASGNHHSAMSGKKSLDHHGGTERNSSDIALCDLAGGPCSGDHHSDETAPSCCAMACHIAIQVSDPEAHYHAMISKVEHSDVSSGVATSMIGRLDRPPRTAGALVG